MPNWARTDLCGGRLATAVPTAMPVSDSGATYTSGRRPKAAKERTRGMGRGECAHCAMGFG